MDVTRCLTFENSFFGGIEPTWVHATFERKEGGWLEDDYIRITARCYKRKENV